MAPRILCRPSVNLPRARHGARVLIDPEDPEMKVLLARGLLVPDLTANAAIAPEERERFAEPLEEVMPEPQEAPEALRDPAAGDPSPTSLPGAREPESSPER